MDPYYHPDARAMAEYKHLITDHKLTNIECVLISRQIRKNNRLRKIGYMVVAPIKT